ncbi:hypothetical protein GCM10009535_33510 [Streptomyces thermocarboxydovorans]|uniref:Uncharacterized protein n=1 Tax=Streptomyces thermocarboxydovorans TaxID=59298 RepID=A0ABN1HIJ4_9ACTN
MFIGGVGERLLGGTEPAFQVPQVGQGEVDGVLHGAGRVEAEGLGEVSGASGELTVISPASGASAPASSRSRVDLPDPFSPTTATFSPGRTVKVTWSRTVWVP